VSRPRLGRGMVPGISMDPGEYCTWGFCNLTVNSGMRIGPVRGLSATRAVKRLPCMNGKDTFPNPSYISSETFTHIGALFFGPCPHMVMALRINGRRLSVRLSRDVDKHSQIKINRKKAHDMCDP